MTTETREACRASFRAAFLMAKGDPDLIPYTEATAAGLLFSGQASIAEVRGRLARLHSLLESAFTEEAGEQIRNYQANVRKLQQENGG